MLPSGSKRSVNGYQVAVMLAVAGLGLVGAPWWMALIAAALLFGSALVEHSEVHARAVTVEAPAFTGNPVWTVAAMSFGYAAVCYIAGAVVHALILA